MSKPRPDLYLALREDLDVACGRCRRVVDLAKECELRRLPSGRLEVSRCHQCVAEKPPIDLVSAVDHLVDAFGVDGARAEITRALSLPAPGSHWRYSDPRSPADLLEFTFSRFAGQGLVFNGPYGEWFCSREDWANHLATCRVRPFLAPLERARA